ncbi:unknown [Prevotella sp. CAG:891]|nr:unknown [Prevotella sp. CAG:891]
MLLFCCFCPIKAQSVCQNEVKRLKSLIINKNEFGTIAGMGVEFGEWGVECVEFYYKPMWPVLLTDYVFGHKKVFQYDVTKMYVHTETLT